MLSTLGYLSVVLVALAASAVVFVIWLSTRKRIAADTIGRATEDARKLVRDAERDSESLKKEALLDAALAP